MIRFVVPYLLYSVTALICVFLQSQIFSHLQIFNAKPDLLLLILVMSALKSDWKNGIAVGFVLGFWIDLINAACFGMNMIVYGLVGAVCGVIGDRFPDRTYEGYFFTAVGASLLTGFLNLLSFQLVGAAPPVGQTIFGTIFPMTFYTALIAFLGLPLVYIYRHLRGRKIVRVDLLGNGVIFVRGNEKVDMKKVTARREEARRRRAERRDREKRRFKPGPPVPQRRPAPPRNRRGAAPRRKNNVPPRRPVPPRREPPPAGENRRRDIGDHRVAPRRDEGDNRSGARRDRRRG